MTELPSTPFFRARPTSLPPSLCAQRPVYYPSDAQREALTDGSAVEITGWFVSISGSRYCNFIIDQMTVNPASSSARRIGRAPAAPVPVVEKFAIYQFDGSKWSVPADFAILNPADYAAMGQSGNTLSNPAALLPIYLKNNFPYAQKDAVRYVVYNNSSDKVACDYYTFDGSEWTGNSGLLRRFLSGLCRLGLREQVCAPGRHLHQIR